MWNVKQNDDGVSQRKEPALGTWCCKQLEPINPENQLYIKLRTTLLQKLAIFYMLNVKQKHNGMDQNTMHGCYGDYVTTNQQVLKK